MPRMTGKQALLESLLAEGVKYVFGNPGTTELPMMDALQDYPQVQYILALQETVAAAAADGYARVSGEPGVVQLHISVGVANGLAMLFDSFRGGFPVVTLAGQQDSRLLVQEPVLWSDMVRTTRQFTKWSTEVVGTSNIPLVVRRAFKEARAHPTGPVFVSFPLETLTDSAEVHVEPGHPPFTRVRPDPAGVQAAARLLASAERPLILMGDGAGKAGAWEAAAALAELIGARVHGTGVLANFPTRHPQFLGNVDLRWPEWRRTVEAADVLLSAGVWPLPAAQPGGPSLPDGLAMVQVDANEWEIAKNGPVAAGVLGDPAWALEEIAAALRDLLPAQELRAAAGRREDLRREKEQLRAAQQRAIEARWDARPISPARLLCELRDVSPPDTIMVRESFGDRLALDGAMDFEPGSYYGLAGGGIGWGMGAALGAKLAAPGRPVVGLVGDGSAMYSIQALYTALRHQIPVVWVVLNNQSYRILKMNMLSQLGETAREPAFIGMDFEHPPLRFERIAAAFGVDAVRVEEPGDLGPALKQAFSSGRPYLVDVLVDGAVERPF